MAIMAGGKVVAQGTPASLIAGLEGVVWEKAIDKSALEDHRNRLYVISHQVSAGRLLLRIRATKEPGDGFRQVAANLEDIYFSTINSLREGNAQDMRKHTDTGVEESSS
jgi:hypothetical protein